MTAYRIMTLNLLTDSLYSFGRPRFQQRVKAIGEMLRINEPDVIGVQEMTETMKPYMSDIFLRYKAAGAARASLFADEYSAVLYRADRFRLIRSDTLWLSEKPFRRGSKLLLSQFPRITTYAVLYDEAEKKTFTVFNTHLDQNFAFVRRRQAEILSGLIKNCQEGTFTVVTGDLNDVPDSPALRVLKGCGLKDTVSDAVGPTLTGRAGTLIHRGRPIDHILVSDHMKLVSLRKLDRKYAGCYPSDHYPLIAEISD